MSSGNDTEGGLKALGSLVAVGWGWFAVPLGARAISGWHALGIATVSMLFQPLRTDEPPEFGVVVGRYATRFAWVAALGYLAHRMMT